MGGRSMEDLLNGSLSNSTAARLERVGNIIGWVTFGIGLPIICLAIYMLSQLVRGGNGTPVQAINLLISDIFNLFTRPQTSNLATGGDAGSSLIALETDIPSLIFYFGVASNIAFLVGVAQERHLLVAGHQCHGLCRRSKKSSVISLLVWAAPVGVVLLLYFGYRLAFAVSLLVPFPLLVLFLLDASRALFCCPVAAALALQRSERRRVFALLVAVFSNYVVLYLPFALTALMGALQVDIDDVYYYYFALAANMLLYLSPVINPFLSMLLTRNLRELMDTLPCCRNKRGARTEMDDSAVVMENPLAALPMPSMVPNGFGNPGNMGVLGSGSGAMVTGGVSTVIENFGAVLGMPGGSSPAGLPSVLGGMTSVPNMISNPLNTPEPFGIFTTESSKKENTTTEHHQRTPPEQEATIAEPPSGLESIITVLTKPEHFTEELQNITLKLSVPEILTTNSPSEDNSNEPVKVKDTVVECVDPAEEGSDTDSESDISTRL